MIGWGILEPLNVGFGSIRFEFLGQFAVLLDYWEDIKDQIMRFTGG